MSKEKPIKENILNVEFTDALSDRYFAYALATITSRSLPDVRDGLKPVHRRLIWAMHQLKLDPKSGYKKCARVVGDVIGKYHPHGDQSVYDALVRLAQSFSVRYPLVDGQGNFGSIDGDNPAAMRYTEARMSEVATALLKDIESDTVDFRDTYDNQDEEPIVLPAAFPNLLANGSEGIAVGMATSIPPHNADELCDAMLEIIKNPNVTTTKLVEHVIAPDFPTGGLLLESKASILNSYETGRGSFRLRAKWFKEELSHGQYQIVVTEIPYQVQKSKLIEKIADLFKEKKLALLGDIRDESDENIRIIFEPKNRLVDADILMESIFKLTDLEIRFNMNLNVLGSNGAPKVMGLKEILQEFLAHRMNVLERKSKNRLSKIDARLEILGGFLIAYLNLDEIIRIIREEDEPKQFMMNKFKLTDNQAEAILNMRLRSLRKLEEVEIKTEFDKLQAEKAHLLSLLSSDDLRWKEIAKEVKETKKAFGKATKLGARRTEVSDAVIDNVISIEAFIEREPITIACSKLGWIRSFKGHNNAPETIKYKEGDEQRFFFKAQTTDKILVFTTKGKFYTIPADKIAGGKGQGDPVRLLVDLSQDEEILEMFVFIAAADVEQKILVAAKSGKGFVVDSKDVVAQTKSGKNVLSVKDGDFAAFCKPINGTHLAIVGENRKLLIFETKEITELKKGQGVTLQKYKDKDCNISDLKFFNLTDGLIYGVKNTLVKEAALFPFIGKRAAQGKFAPTSLPKNNKFDG
jgi:topoisomerase IV subunit A